MSTNLERRTLAASCSGIPHYEGDDAVNTHESVLKSDVRLKNSPSIHSLPILETASPLEYRKLLLEKRNSIKNSWHDSKSEEESDGGVSDSSDDDKHATSNGSLLLDNKSNMSNGQKFNGETNSKASEENTSVNEIDVHLSDVSCPEKHLLSSDSQVILKISIPEQTLTKCLRIELTESIWNAKQMVLKSLAVPLTDTLNYGLFSNDLGYFLLDHKLISEYVQAEQVGFYELRYKTRVYIHPVRPGTEARRLCKMQGDSKRKELMRYIRQRNVEKLCRLLNKGVDPNFHTPHDGETPLTTVIANYNPGVTESVAFEYVSVPVMKALIKGGAHFDFRNQQGFTPLHVAVRNGNAQAVETLLSLGAPPDSLDTNEYTPLYHCSLSDTSADCIAPLCHSGADIACVNSQKWTILHQICRYGRFAHLETTLDVVSSIKGAEKLLSMQNESGNTALHICAIYNVQQCLIALLNAGIDESIRNYSHQDAFQVAVVARNMNSANLIQGFPKLTEQEISMLMAAQETEKIETPTKSKGKKITRRHTISAAIHKNSRSSQRQIPFGKGKGSAATLSGIDIEVVGNPTLSRGQSIDTAFPATSMGSVASSSDIGDSGSNKVGTSREGTYSLAEDTVYSMANEASAVIETHETSFANEKQLTPTEKEQANDKSIAGASESDVNATDDIMMRENGDVSLQATSHPDVYHRYRNVSLSRGSDGYGFVLKGAKDKSIENFAATARHPGLQYLELVEEGSNAHRVGLRDGDFILKINGVDVTCMGHKQTVDVIRKLRDPLRMRVVTVVSRSNELDHEENIDSDKSQTTSPIMTSSTIPTSPDALHRTESIRSALGKLDSVLALEDAIGETGHNTATLRRRPISRRLRSQDIEEIFRYDEALRKSESDAYEEPVKRNLRMSVSASSRLVRVLPPIIPTSPSVPVDEISSNEVSYPPQNHINQTHTFTATVSSPSFGSNQLTRHASHLSSPAYIDSRKGPPLPPERRDSRLTDSDAGSVSTQRTPPFSPATHGHFHGSSAVSIASDHSHSKSFAPSSMDKVDFSGFASEAILRAQRRQQRISSNEGAENFSSTPITHHLVSKPPPTVAPKPGRGKSNPSHSMTDAIEEPKSAFSIALAAKKEKLKQRSQTGPTSVFTHPPVTVKSTVGRPNDVVDSRNPTGPTEEELRELSQLPPPPPIPTNDPSSPLYYNLPPPPPPSSSMEQQNRFDQVILPPPPESMLPPPPSHTSGHAAASKVNKRNDNQQNTSKFNDRFTSVSTNGVDSGSSADSGVYEFATQPPPHNIESKPNVDNMSVVSSVSTLSSEDGSDVGVSLSYDHKPSPEKITGNMYLNVLKKNKNQSNAPSKPAAGMVLTKVSFTGSKTSMTVEPAKSNFSAAREPIRNVAVSHVPANEPIRNVVTTQVPANETTRNAVNHVAQSSVNEKKVVETTKKAPVTDISSVTSKPVLKWTVDDVCKWLTGLGLASYTQMFAENEIVGSHLPDLSKDDLQELGITRVGHRLTFERSLKKLLNP